MNKKYITSILCIIILIFSFLTVSYAENVEDLRIKKEEINEKIDDANQKIDGIEIELTDLLKQINDLNTTIYGYEEQIELLNINLTNMQEEISKVEQELALMQEKFDNQKKAFENRIVALYEMGETKYLDVLLSSNSLSDFISNYYLISEIAQYDTDILESIQKQKIEIEETKKILEEKRQALKAEKDNKEKTLVALENTKVIKNNYASQLSEEETKVQNELDAYQAEYNTIEKQILAISMQSVGSSYVGGTFAWPTPGYSTITSNFGQRYHPIFKVYRFHSGVDIGAPSGASIVAANSGRVTQSTYTSSYGNLVMIDHGGGMVTVYAHGTKRLVEVGQTVVRGETIMTVGSTGYSTGPHLHFEVRQNGTCVNPIPYITN